jgi:hypothetical protein
VVAPSSGLPAPRDGFRIEEVIQEKPGPNMKMPEDEALDVGVRQDFAKNASNLAGSSQAAAIAREVTSGPSGATISKTGLNRQDSSNSASATATADILKAQRLATPSGTFEVIDSPIFSYIDRDKHWILALMYDNGSAALDWYKNIEEPKREGFLADIVLSAWFQIMCGFVIVLNSVSTAFAVNYQMEVARGGPEDPNMSGSTARRYFSSSSMEASSS